VPRHTWRSAPWPNLLSDAPSITHACRKDTVLLEEHRIELGRDAPVQMFVAHADTVTVRGGR